MFGKRVRKNFEVERKFSEVPQRILVQQFEMKFLDEQGVRDMIDSLEARVKELKLQLKGYE